MINSIVRAADILEGLSEGINRTTDIADRLKISNSTAHRLLRALERSRFVMRDPASRRYYLGYLINKLASDSTIAHQNLIVCASDDMKSLWQMSGETVLLHLRIGAQRICLEELQSQHSIKYIAGRGIIVPIYVGSAGKVLLSELDEEELKIILETVTLEPVSTGTITDKEVLVKELEKARKEGYAVSFGERVLGSASISVPIRNYVCPIALSIIGPDYRLSPRIPDLLEEMKRSAARISKKLLKVAKRNI